MTIVLRGGTVFDGLGSPGVVADVLVSGGLVRQVGTVDVPPGARILACDGLFVAPGFVDAHAHSDLAPFLPEPQPFKLLQGVTTEINGNCGISFAPADAPAADLLAGALHDVVRGIEVRPMGFGAFLEAVRQAGPVNHVAYLVGHGTLRLTANGPGEELAPGALERMTRLAAESFEAGAIGFSTGLIYPPGCYADLPELQALARAAAPYGSIYATHMRDEGRRVLDAIDEAVAVARAGRLRLQVSHCKLAGRENHGRAGELLARIDQARRTGVDALGDQYPYTAAATMLAALLPNYALDGGLSALPDRLADPAFRSRLREQAGDGEPGDGIWGEAGPDGILVTAHADPAVSGRTLAELAGDRDAFDVLCDVLARDPAAGMVISAMAEEDVREIMASPLIGIGSDNALPGPAPVHPRTYGTFPRLLGRYVRELNVLSWAEAIRKATSLTAGHFGLRGRGTLLPGSHADIVVFDPATIGHDGSPLAPDPGVTGVLTVLLDGEPVVRDGSFTGRRCGQVLRGTDRARTAHLPCGCLQGSSSGWQSR
ncbi:N-acyl-D-amino-acid deacylase family protein [Nonomuraea polychroma]|uniref:N-acyl-D-amino-acid deacylase family protein n=1 Tax=Nonomuraea polychroma TaxID=46176 RepID=UPI003D90D5D8